MKWEKLEQKLLTFGYTKHSIKKIKEGKQLPTLIKAFELSDKFNIPLSTWKPFTIKYRQNKSFISNNSTSEKSCEQELQGDKKSA